MPTRNKHQTDTPNVDLDALMRDFGRAVREARDAAGKTQEVLAREWHMSRSVVANLERGEFHRPAYRRAHKTFDNLPIITEYEEPATDASPEDPERSAPAEFEQMLLDRAREVSTLLGTWHALWETEVDERVVFNSEVLEFRSMRSRKRLMITNPLASPENPKGGYPWRAECRVVDKTGLLGVYIATTEEITSKGALHLRVHPHGRLIEGQWIGEGYDNHFARGRVVICRDRDELKHRMEVFIGEKIDFEFKDQQYREGTIS